MTRTPRSALQRRLRAGRHYWRLKTAVCSVWNARYSSALEPSHETEAVPSTSHARHRETAYSIILDAANLACWLDPVRPGAGPPGTAKEIDSAAGARRTSTTGRSAESEQIASLPNIDNPRLLGAQGCPFSEPFPFRNPVQSGNFVSANRLSEKLRHGLWVRVRARLSEPSEGIRREDVAGQRPGILSPPRGGASRARHGTNGKCTLSSSSTARWTWRVAFTVSGAPATGYTYNPGRRPQWDMAHRWQIA